jgi:hypothetical protein
MRVLHMLLLLATLFMFMSDLAALYECTVLIL